MRGSLLAVVVLSGLSAAAPAVAQADPLQPMRAALDACAAQAGAPMVVKLRCAADAMRLVPESHAGRHGAIQHANRLERIALDLEAGRENETEAMRRAGSSEAMAQQEWSNAMRQEESQRARRRVE
ncbi:hypothetical protein [Muricoccus radiodurans]|uniref:hypothetical protein n=1 Tax=Muricoccus radiodurans TaxID=2231721 RepID=UPI003CF17E90